MTDHGTMKRCATRLRCNQTPWERVLWQRLRMRQLAGVRFIRQYVAGRYVLDFYAPSLRLAIELDGGRHYEIQVARRDAARSCWLASRGIKVLRYMDPDVSERLDDVLEDIERVVAGMRVSRRWADRQSAAHPPAAARRPPSCGRG